MFLPILIIAVSLFADQLYAAGDLTAHTCQRRVNALLQQDGYLYSATTGGLFLYDITAAAFEQLTVLEGLSVNDTRKLTITGDDLVWTATAGAGLELFEPSYSGGGELQLQHIGTFQEFADDAHIFTIHDLAAWDDWVLVATDIGFTKMRWDPAAGGFSAAYTIRRPGELGYEIPVFRIGIFNERIVLAAESGLALHNPELGEPDQPASWEAFPIFTPDDTILQLETGHGAVWVLSSDMDGTGHLFRLDDEGVVEALQFDNPRSLAVTPEELLLADHQRIYTFSGQPGDPLLPLAEVTNLNCFARNSGGDWFHRSSTWTDPGGLRRLESTDDIIIPGPAMESVTDLQYDHSGRLWITGQSAGAVGAGCAVLTGEEWTNYTCQDSAYRAQMHLSTGLEAFNEMLVDGEGWVWLSTWGYGLLLYRPDLDRFFVYDEQSAPGHRFHGLLIDGQPHPEFPITAGLSEDHQGNIWVINNRSLTDSILVAIPAEFHADTNTTFHYFAFDESNLYSVYAGLPGSVWAGAGRVLSGAGGTNDWGSSSKDIYGLIDLPPDQPAWEAGPLTSVEISLAEEQYNSGIDGSSGFITAMQADLDGNFWVATTDGLYYSSIFLVDLTLFNRLLYVEGLSSEVIYCLAVDPRNRLWVGTDFGLDVLDVSTFLFTDHYTEAATGVPWSEVRALDFNPVNGDAAVLTGQGIFILRVGLAEHPAQQAADLHPYPNPFRPGQHARVALPPEEVSRYATAAIYTVSGRLVRRLSGVELDLHGWDGRADSGELVPTGVYLILLSGSEGKGIGKIAVIR